MNQKFKNLVKLFQRLPGVGPRQAARFVISLLDQPEENLKELGESINNLKRDISFCGECFNISDNSYVDPASRGSFSANCHICHDAKRDRNKIMVVEKITDLESIEKTGLYRGLYHVLGGAINPLERVIPANLKIEELKRRVEDMSRDGLPAQAGEIELIIATNPNTPGETTALYLKNYFADKKGIIITRLGRGLSSGSNLEYTDETTLKHALDYRR